MADWTDVYCALEDAMLTCNPFKSVVYVYRVEGRKVVKPYLYKTGLVDDPLRWLSEEFGTGTYRVLIREGKTMRFSGTVGVKLPLGQLGRQQH